MHSLLLPVSLSIVTCADSQSLNRSPVNKTVSEPLSESFSALNLTCGLYGQVYEGCREAA